MLLLSRLGQRSSEARFGVIARPHLVFQTPAAAVLLAALFIPGAFAAGGSASAVFQPVDTSSQGNWVNRYGSDGYQIANSAPSLPSYATVSVNGANSYTWYASTTDARAPWSDASMRNRIASTYYSGGAFSFDVNLTDGLSHTVALYCLDFDTSSRAEKVSIVDANSQAVLDTENVTNFHNGTYLVWNVQGHVQIQVSYLAGLNSVVSGIFFGSSAPAVSLTSPSAGSVSGTVTLGANASSAVGMASVQFQLDGGSLGSAVAGAGPVYSSSWNTTTAVNGNHTLTALATDTQGRQSMSAGVLVTVTGGLAPLFNGVDSTTQGNWVGKYGGDGYIIPNAASTPPAYASVTINGASAYTWYPTTTDVRAPWSTAAMSSRIASTYYTSSSLTFDVNLTDGQKHVVALYCLDFDSSSRAEKISVLNAGTQSVLDTENVTNFHNGEYLVWNLQGHVQIQVTYTGGLNAVVSGIFFGPGGIASSPPPPAVNLTSPSAGTISGTVAVTANATASAGMSSVQFQLDGANLGAAVAGAGPSYSISWDTRTSSNANHSITAIATDALGQKTTSAPLSVTVSNSVPAPVVSLTSPASGNVSGTVIASANATASAGMSSVQFQLDGANLGSAVAGAGPAYSISWDTTTANNGNHSITAIATDALGQKTTSASLSVTVNNTASTTATFLNADTATQGNWVNAYGQDGYQIANTPASLPAYAVVNISGASSYTWYPSTTDARAPWSSAAKTNRIASTYYSSSSFTIDINLIDGQTHTVALYCLDFDSTGRAESISILNAQNGAIMSTQPLANFHNGIYEVWSLQGHVQIQVNYTGGLNAVMSGIFFGPRTTAPPAVSITSPSAGPVSGNVTVSATATSAAGIASVQFQLDGSNLGGPVTGAGPGYSTTWNSATATNGSHVLTAIATDAAGQHATSAPIAVSVTGGITTPPPLFGGLDATTQGSWKNVYGTDGYLIANDSTDPAGYATVSITGASVYTWTASTADPRALQKSASASDRLAATYYSNSSFTLDVNLTDGRTHPVALYLLDYDTNSRAEHISIVDATTNSVLDTENLSNFHNGLYAIWNLQGHVLIQIANAGGLNAVLSGIFFGGAGSPAPPPPTTAVTSPTPGATISGVVTVTAAAASTVGITSVQFQLDGSNLGAPISGDGPYSIPWDSASGTSGSHTLTATATDTLGRQITSAGVTVTVTNTGQATLTISTWLLNFSAVAGGTNPVPQDVTIDNSGGGTLNWTATKTQAWVTLSSTSGTAPASLLIGVAPAGLPAGLYTDLVTVTAPGAARSPLTIQVTLYLGAPPSTGPVANWTFEPNTISGNTLMDTSGNNLNGSISGNALPASGKIGQGFSFDGQTGYVATASNPLAAMAPDVTIAAWVQTGNASRVESLISKFNPADPADGYILETTSGGYVALHLGGNNITGPQDFVDGTNPINDGQWHHVAVIIRTGQDISFYVDGGLSSIYYLPTTEGGFSSPVSIGGPALAGSNFFTGKLDEVRIYNRALSTSEIAQLYGGSVTTIAGGQVLYNGIALPKNFPPPAKPTQMFRTPYYINDPPRVIPIDVGRQLFVDDFLIEQTTLQRTQHQPSLYPNPVLTPAAPISGGAWYDPASQLYKMWYYNGTTNDYRYTYSNDGKNWTLPTYPDVLVPNTNEVVTGGDTVWLDLQETDPSRRYKSFGVDAGALKIYVYFSADGIHWGPKNDFNINTLSDRSTVFWNPFRRVWVNSDRSQTVFPATTNRDAASPRARFYSESSNLTNWTPADPSQTFWTGPDDQDPPYYLNNPGGQPPELYNLDAVAYESVMVGLFSWFYPGAGYGSYTLPGPILVELGVGFSRDGFSWVRPTRGSGPSGAFIPASDIAGTWNAYNTQSVGGGFLVVGDELWFYFTGRSLQKPLNGTFSTGLATLRRDGFYSMDAASVPGTLTTHPVRFAGSHLFVNVNDPSGQLTVDVLDQSGNVIPGFSASNCLPVSVNKTLQEITWNGVSLSSLSGQSVKFRFNLTNGSLYSFWVTASAQGASNGYVAGGGPGFTGVIDTVGSANQ